MSHPKGLLLTLTVALLLGACGGSSTHKPPAYPYPEPKDVEDTDLGVYLDEEDALEEAEDSLDD